MSRKYLLRKIIGNRSFLDYNPKKFWTDRGKVYLNQDMENEANNPESKRIVEDKKKALIETFREHPKAKKVLEIGVGYGANMKILLEEFPKRKFELVGTDISESQLRTARKYLGAKKDKVKLRKHDLAKPLPFKDNSFDIVLCCGVLMHILPKNIGFVTSEMKRVSKDLLFVAERTNPYREGERHMNNFVFNYNINKLFDDCRMLKAREGEQKHFEYLFSKKLGMK